jgi:FlaG/FlaF family flagellin (archaellin)
VEAVVSRPDGEDSVSSVVGTILMLAVTVSVFGGLSIVVLAEIRSNDPPPQADLAFTADGDRAVLTHQGGEPIPLEGSFLLLNVNGAEIRYDLTEVADQTSDGRFWRIGETLCLSGPDPADPAIPCLVDGLPILGVAIVAGGGLLADEGERGADAGPCPLDNDAPTVPAPLAFSPSDVLSTTTGTVAVSLTATDDCAGMDDAVAPLLFYRINDGSDPAFTALGAMANAGPGQWTGTVPSQSWNLLGGQTLQVYASGATDLNGNAAGATATETEDIDAVILETYVTAATANPGTAEPLADAQDDGGAAMAVTEGGTLVPAGTAGPTMFSGTTQVGSTGVVSPQNVLASDNARTELADLNNAVEVSGFDLPTDAATVTAISIGFEGLREGTSGTPQVRLDYKVGTGAYVLGTPATVSATTDTEYNQPVSGTFSVADIEAMTVRVILTTNDNRDPFVDHVFVRVTYTTAAYTTYRLDAALEFAGTADGSRETLQLRYTTSGDTFEVQVWDAVASAFVARGTLSSATFTTFEYQLVDNGAIDEYNGGAPRIRLVDLAPSGTTQGSLQIDYARMVTV